MSCENCKYPQHDQYGGHVGRWWCLHPYRDELDNRGEWTFPKFDNPTILICTTPKELFGDYAAHLRILDAAPTPKWCYLAAVERAKEENPSFDPDAQRKILYSKEVDAEVAEIRAEVAEMLGGRGDG